MSKIVKLLSCAPSVLLLLTAISVFALTAAFVSEAFLGLEPCILCVYQRWPFAAVIGLGVIGLFLRNKGPVPQIMVGLSGLSMLINSVIATYHTGVEQKWWMSKVEGCTIPSFGDTEPQSILENIMSAPTGNCAEIPWQDPLLGLSMANYNAMMCFGLFVLCAVSLVLSLKKRQTSSSQP